MDIRKPGSFEPSKVGSEESQQIQPSPKQSDKLGAEGIAQVSDALESAKLPDAFNSAINEAADSRQAIDQEPSKTQNVSTGGMPADAAAAEGAQESAEVPGSKIDFYIENEFYSNAYQDHANAWLHSSTEENDGPFRAGFDLYSGTGMSNYFVAYSRVNADSGEDPYASVDAGFGAFSFGAVGYHALVDEDKMQADGMVWFDNSIGLGVDASMEDGQLKIGSTVATQVWFYVWQPIGVHFDLVDIDTNEVKKGAEEIGAWLDEVTPDSVDQFVNDTEQAAADAASAAVHAAADAAQAVADTLQESADSLDNFLDSVLGS